MRLTGHHETASINTFSYGVADRGASIRVPHSFMKNDYKGYLEDRRPNSQGDPYQIASQILKTIATVPLRDRRRQGRVSAPSHDTSARRRTPVRRRVFCLAALSAVTRAAVVDGIARPAAPSLRT